MKTVPGVTVNGALLVIKKYPCSRCGTQYSGSQKGQRHRGCKASPAGLFGVVELTEKSS